MRGGVGLCGEADSLSEFTFGHGGDNRVSRGQHLCSLHDGLEVILHTGVSEAKATSTLGCENVVGGSTGREGTD